MKKITRILLIALALVALFAVVAFAATEHETDGIYDVNLNTGYTAKFYKADGTTEAANDSGFYGEAVRFDLTIANTEASKYYMVFVLKGDSSTPTENNIWYLDQATASGDSVTMKIYPKDLEETTYKICVSTNASTGSYTEVGSFKFYQAYVLGDVDANGAINADDALLILQYAVNLTDLNDTQKLAANVTIKQNHDTQVNADDALMILQYAVNIITEF